MKLDFAVVADYALVDQVGKISVLGMYQHIWVQQFPAMHPRLHLVLRLRGKRTEIGEHHVQIRLLDEQDTEILGGNGQVTFAEPAVGVISCLTAAPIGEPRQALADSLTHPVRFRESLLRLAADGATSFVDVGPGRVLEGLARRTLPEAEVAVAEVGARA